MKSSGTTILLNYYFTPFLLIVIDLLNEENMSFAKILRLGVIGVFLFAILTLVGCNTNREGNAPTAIVEVIPPSGSTISPYTPIMVTFDSPPDYPRIPTNTSTIVDNSGYTESEPADISWSVELSQEGNTVTITGPFNIHKGKRHGLPLLISSPLASLILTLRWDIGDQDARSTRNAESEVTLVYTVVPDWADGVFTIKAGRFESPEDLLTAIQDEKRIWIPEDYIQGSVEGTLLGADPDVPPAALEMKGVEYTFDVVVFSLSEIEIRHEPTIDEIREQCREFGYRPLTVEEVCELRLQFLDQGSVPFFHKMHAFYTLPEKGMPHTFILYRSRYDNATMSAISDARIFVYPHGPGSKTPRRFKHTGYHWHYTPMGARTGARFAGAIVGSEKIQ